jgi:NAD(P)-dependent dehydrogenase (short-subunit alcohol dehydrogenase family)
MATPSVSSSPVVLITGASRGIGHAIALSLLSTSNANLVLVARTTGPLEDLQKEYPDRIEAVGGDVTQSEVVAEAVGAAVGKWGRLDGLVVNHGTMGAVDKIEDLSLDGWRKGFEINFFSAVELVRTYLLVFLSVFVLIVIYISDQDCATTSTKEQGPDYLHFYRRLPKRTGRNINILRFKGFS